MIQTKKCPKCGDNRIAGPHKVFGQAHIRIDLPGISTATLESYTCANCGYTEFYSDKQGLQNTRTSGRFIGPSWEKSLQRIKCPTCGASVSPDTSYCKECGNIIE